MPVSDSIDGISVDGAFGEAPAVSFDAPFAIDKTRKRVLIKGTGPKAPKDGILEVNYVGINGRTGETFDSSYTRGSASVMSLTQVVAGFQKGLTGAQPGERVLIVIPGSDGYDSAGGSADAGIEVGDTLVFVVDVIAEAVDEPTGKAQSPDLPVTIGQDSKGYPTVKIPSGSTAPTNLVAEPIIKGSQRGVEATDYILVKYRTYSWKTGKKIEDTYPDGDGGQLSSTLDAWKTGLLGMPIGSRVVIIAPDPYPNGNDANPKVSAGDTLVYVIDIVFASSVTG